MAYRAVLFDMDGTTLDTLTDLRLSMNHALSACGHRGDFPAEVVRLFFGSAVQVAVQRALAAEAGASGDALLKIGETKESDADPAEIERILSVYRPYYNAHCEDHAAPYPGIGRLLSDLRTAGIKTAVVSNKPDAAVQRLVETLFPGQFDFCLGQTDGVPRKPAPDMTLSCLSALGVDRHEAVYIGDSEVDLATAKNAELPVIAVSWGFRGRDFLERQGAGQIADTAEDLARLLMDQ